MDIGGTTYNLEVAVVAPPVTHVYARGIGLIQYRYVSSGTRGSSKRTSWKLIAATVGGTTYGTFPTPADPTVVGEPSTVVAFPNPTASRTTLRIQAATAGALEIAVYDVLGREVWSSTRAIPRGVSDLEVGLESAPAGVYHVRAVLDGVPFPSVRVTKR